jgi:triacylglycerol lipase
MSGLYRLARELVPPASLYYGEDAESYATRAPMSHVNRSSVPLFLSNAEYDPGFLSAPTYDLAQQVTLRDGRSPRFRFFTGHNHISTVMSIGTEQDDVGAAVRDFINCFG